MQREPIEVYFERLAASGYQPLLHRVTGTLRFDIDQNDGISHRWYVTIDYGHLTVRRDEDGRATNEAAVPADCTLAADEGEFLRILSGQDSFAAAFVRGAITVKGDYTLAQNIRRFSPPAQTIPGIYHDLDATTAHLS
jgi:putative sterol carrier protein